MNEYRCLENDIQKYSDNKPQKPTEPREEDKKDFSALTQEQKKVVFGRLDSHERREITSATSTSCSSVRTEKTWAGGTTARIKESTGTESRISGATW